MGTIYEDIYKFQSRHLTFDARKEDPVLVVFSAIPGSGKSELTKRLMKSYGFMRITNKDIREAIEKTGHKDDVIIGDYTLWLFTKLAEKGPVSIVFDRNIDQWYEPAKEWAARNGYTFVVVHIDVSPETLKERLLTREGSPTAHVFKVLDFYSEQHNKMRASIKADVELKGDFDLDEAARLIESL